MQDLTRFLLLIGLVFAVCGLLVYWYGCYCFYADLFDVSRWWGLAALFVPGMGIVAAFIFHTRVWKSLVTQSAGIVTTMVGGLAMQTVYWY